MNNYLEQADAARRMLPALMTDIERRAANAGFRVVRFFPDCCILVPKVTEAENVYTRLAKCMFATGYPTPKQRQAAKERFFGILYGAHEPRPDCENCERDKACDLAAPGRSGVPCEYFEKKGLRADINRAIAGCFDESSEAFKEDVLDHVMEALR